MKYISTNIFFPLDNIYFAVPFVYFMNTQMKSMFFYNLVLILTIMF